MRGERNPVVQPRNACELGKTFCMLVNDDNAIIRKKTETISDVSFWYICFADKLRPVTMRQSSRGHERLRRKAKNYVLSLISLHSVGKGGSLFYFIS